MTVPAHYGTEYSTSDEPIDSEDPHTIYSQ